MTEGPEPMTSHLVLVRHGESEWNKLNLFTGWRDVDLTEKGVLEAERAGDILKREELGFDIAFTSGLKRAQRTLDIILSRLGQQHIEIVKDRALNERDYGDLTGLNKDEARQRWGDEQVLAWRRSYDVAPPGGESLKDTAQRVLPYFESMILPRMKAGRNVIVVAHGNSLRALIMHLEGLSPAQILEVNLATGAPLIYRLNADGGVAMKRDLAA